MPVDMLPTENIPYIVMQEETQVSSHTTEREAIQAAINAAESCSCVVTVNRDLSYEISFEPLSPPSFWSSVSPGDSVTIPEGETVVYDGSAPTQLNELIVNGELIIKSLPSQLQFNSLRVNGSLLISESPSSEGQALSIKVVNALSVAETGYVQTKNLDLTLEAQSLTLDGIFDIGHQVNLSDNVTSIYLSEGVMLNGSLIVGQQDFNLTADWVMNHGNFFIGSDQNPYVKNALLTFTGDPSQNVVSMNHSMGTRGIMSMNGNLVLVGDSPSPTWTKIDQHIQPGSTGLTVLPVEGWEEGDKIVIAPTDFYEVGSTSLHTLSAVSNNALTVQEPVEQFRWGLMQYATADGITTTKGANLLPLISNSEGSTPTELDQRAEVGNLSRNIVIQGADDQFWQEEGFGAHVMVMGLDSTVKVDGVEFRRSGQAGNLGRYPFHWHRVSYPDGVNDIGDAVGHYVKNSSIHNSANRCITIHATNGVTLENNICYNIKGHGIFFEDAVERRNVVENNLVLHVRNPADEDMLLLHEHSQKGVQSSSSGLWVTNPDNTIRNNVFADSEGFGMWMSFPKNPLSVSSGVDIIPNKTPFGNFDGNTSHSNGLKGVMFDLAPVDNAGKLGSSEYGPTSTQDDPGCPYKNYQRFTIKGWKLWKNTNNYWHRARCANYEEFVNADGFGKSFSGGGRAGVITRSLIVGSSLNNFSENPKPHIGPASALATYHSTYDMTNNVIMNFPLVEGKTSGAFATDDYYFRAVEKGTIRNTGNLLINSHPGHRSDARVNEGIVGNFARGYDHYSLAGAVWDPNGYWGPSYNWNVYNEPFFTYGGNCQVASQNAASCDGEYFGLRHYHLDLTGNYYRPMMAVLVERLDEQNLNNVIGTWRLEASESKDLLPGMKDAALRSGGIYKLSFPGESLPQDISIDITNVKNQNDYFVLAISFSGSKQVRVYATTSGYPQHLSDSVANAENSSSKHTYVGLTSLQEVLSSQGETFWQDASNNLVWVKVSRISLQSNIDPEDPFSDSSLYDDFRLRMF